MSICILSGRRPLSFGTLPALFAAHRKEVSEVTTLRRVSRRPSLGKAFDLDTSGDSSRTEMTQVAPQQSSQNGHIPSLSTDPRDLSESRRPDVRQFESKDDFRRDFVSGLWSIRPYRLHIADASTNTSADSGCDTAPDDLLNSHSGTKQTVSASTSCQRELLVQKTFNAHFDRSHCADSSSVEPASSCQSEYLPPTETPSELTSSATACENSVCTNLDTNHDYELLSRNSPELLNQNLDQNSGSQILQTRDAIDWMAELPSDTVTVKKSAPIDVVVAIDIGTCASGYAYCFVDDPVTGIGVMRR